MPIIQFTNSDVLASKLLDTGYYTGHFTDIAPAKESKSGLSVTYFTEFVIDSGQYEGKSFKIAFNTATSGNSLLGESSWFPSSKLTRVGSICTGKSFDVGTDNQLDTDDCLNVSLDVSISQATNDQGTICNLVTDFFPAGTMNKQPGL